MIGKLRVWMDALKATRDAADHAERMAVRAKVVAAMQDGETAKTLPGHHTGALAVITHPERMPQLLMPDGTRRDVVPASDRLIDEAAWERARALYQPPRK